MPTSIARVLRAPVWCVALCAAITTAAGSAHATSILRIGFSDVVETAQTVVEGRVVERWSERSPNNQVHTFVRLDVIDVIKGPSAGNQIVLRFLGGEADGMRFHVSGMNVPSLSEHGIYFLNGTDNAINPLVGWTQGHFLLRTDAAGAPRVYTHAGHPVFEVQEARSEEFQVTYHEAFGVRIRSEGSEVPLTLDAFRNQVIAIDRLDRREENRVEQ